MKGNDKNKNIPQFVIFSLPFTEFKIEIFNICNKTPYIFDFDAI